MRIIVLLAVSALLPACLTNKSQACDDPSVDECLPLSHLQLYQTSIEGSNPRVLYIEFAQPNIDTPKIVRLECDTADKLSDCVKGFVVPDLDRLPHASAKLLGIPTPVEATSGTFRIDKVEALSNPKEQRVAGSVQSLRFETPDETVVIDQGPFDLVITEAM